MRLFTINSERLPMVWFLLGLLINTAGLYLGFEYSLAFGFMIVGLLSCAFGLVLFVLQRMEPPTRSAATRLSPEFVSVGSTDKDMATQNVENEQATERSA